MANIHILMATYNGEKYVREQLDSIINQTYTDWKLFISDDCSSDGTLKILEQYEKKYANKIMIINKTQKFGSAKENFRYLYAECPESSYYMFSDQDDVWLPDKIEKMLIFYESHIKNVEPGIVYCDLKVVDKQLNTINDSFIEYQKLNNHTKDKRFILTDNYIPGCVMLYNHKLREIVEYIPEKCFMHDWWLVLSATYLGQIKYLKESLNMYRQHDENVIGSNGALNSFDECKNIVKGLLRNPINLTRNFFENIKSLLQIRIAQAAEFNDIYRNNILIEDRELIEEFIKIGDRHHKVNAVIIFLKFFKEANLVKRLYYILAIIF